MAFDVQLDRWQWRGGGLFLSAQRQGVRSIILTGYNE
jgi:hypothetical protein